MSSGRTVTVPGVADALDGTALLRWGRLCLTELERHRAEINALNVFPVPDADTGTNLLNTMRAAVRGAEEATAGSGAGTSAAGELDRPEVDAMPREPENTAAGAGRGAGAFGADVAHGSAQKWPVGGFDVGDSIESPGDAGVGGDEPGPGVSAYAIASAMARAATAGARGNSGIILSQVLRGMADAVCDGPLTETTLRFGLRRAAGLVREALSSPVEGTMLTVLDCAAESAGECPERTLSAVALAAADGAAKALEETPSQLGALREAGVVDAGARGLLVLLDELVVVTGAQPPTRPTYVRGESGVVSHQPSTVQSGAVLLGGVGVTAGTAANSVGVDVDSGDRAYGGMGGAVGEAGAPMYEVMYRLSGSDDERAARLRDRLAELGDSVVVVGDGAGSWSAHVHCADAGAAVEAGLTAGALSGIRIESLAVSEHAPEGVADRGILAVASGEGAVRLFEDSGAAVLEGEVTAEALLAGIRGLPHREVLVLPNGALPAHELVAVSVAARDGQREVLMLPSASMVQGLAALSMHDGGRIAVDDAFAMSEAAAGTRWGALRVAPERALTIVGTCDAGDGLGLVGHDVVVIDADVRAAGRTLLDRMLGLGGELVTMLMGADAPEGLSAELSEHVAAAFPGVEVVVYPGGQPGDLVQIGVE
ncbi:DAK2 domain-containing protein [Nocardia sp. NPDC127526]|uniref:DAK2 domain-containing protein n=1 Tax=Nocardia sp. NPDC127526 TaxID=3345393 RepID=UPI003637F14E